jgi:SPX domain protein involved in polyphosphate accumulation
MISATRPVTAIQRFECKYVVSESEARSIAASLAPHLRPDPNAARSPDHTYAICSLYLDNDALALCHETLAGNANRFKLRIRTYDDSPRTPLFLEVKSRANGVVHKIRARVKKPLLPALLAGRAVDIPGMNPTERGQLDEFIRLMLLTRATPRVLVRYDRQAYAGTIDDGVRVTFDRRLRGLRTDRAEVIVESGAFRPMRTGGVILELKFNDRCPAWLLRIVQMHGLRRRSFSKYCTCMQGTNPSGAISAE